MGKIECDTNDAPSIITHVLTQNDNTLLVRGTTADNGVVKKVLVNNAEAKATAANFAEWEITLPKKDKLAASSEDAAGNAEPSAHVLTLN